MTDDQEWERLERIARLLAQPDLRGRRESREQLKKLKALEERDRIEAERRADLRKAQKPPEPLDADNS